MNPANSAFKTLLDGLAVSVHDQDAATADNHLFEERVSTSRQAEYEAMVGAPADKAEWASLHDKKYLGAHVKTPGEFDVPTTFLASNDAALCPAIEGNQDIVRIESLVYIFKEMSAPPSVEQLQTFLKERDTGKSDALEMFMQEWNRARLNWPMFGTFYDIVRDEADSDDWPHLLRDRLGLGYEGSDAAPIPVALMRYPARLVLDKAKKDGRVASGFALPTVLDGDLNPFYFPAPAGHPYGATLNLSAPWSDRLTAEILNLRIDYQAQHICKVGYIRRPIALGGLRKRRDQHLQLLRSETGSADFGRLMEGR